MNWTTFRKYSASSIRKYTTQARPHMSDTTSMPYTSRHAKPSIAWPVMALTFYRLNEMIGAGQLTLPSPCHSPEKDHQAMTNRFVPGTSLTKAEHAALMLSLDKTHEE